MHTDPPCLISEQLLQQLLLYIHLETLSKKELSISQFFLRFDIQYSFLLPTFLSHMLKCKSIFSQGCWQEISLLYFA